MNFPILPERLIDVNAGKSITLELTHLDKDKALVVPTTLEYRIDDITNQRTVLDWTTVSSPSSTNSIVITAVQNAKFNLNQRKELRQITTKATDSTGAIDPEEFYYNLVQIFTREAQE